MYTSNALSNSATTMVVVLRSALVASILSGSASSSSVAQPLVINASASYDPDATSTRPTSLSFSWLCTMGGNACTNAAGGLLGLPALPTLAFAAYTLRPNTTCIHVFVLHFLAPLSGLTGSEFELVQDMFSVVVTAADSRTASASSSISIVAGSPPIVSIVQLQYLFLSRAFCFESDILSF